MIKILNINPEGINKQIFDHSKYKIDNFSFPSISFNPTESSDFNIDSFIVQKVINEISLKDFDLIIMPVSLTANFLEFVGLRLAYHLRLTKSKYQFVPIIFLCDINLNGLLKLDILCQILYSDGSYLSKTSADNVVELLDSGRVMSLNDDKFKGFINKINFTAPDSYLSNHSVANEWGISRWADVLNVDDSKISEVKENIESLLYFKYLLNKYPPLGAVSVNYSLITKGKIVYIDDEWNKGWKSVMEKFFSFSRLITFKVLEENFKDKTSTDVVSMVKDYIVQEDPDLIILDLRLNDKDFNHNTLTLFTGYNILKEIKALNPGFQVIIFSATSKIWNLLELQKIGANGFILKESPDLNVENNYAKQSILKFKDDVEEGLSKSKHRSIWRLINNVRASRNYSNILFLSESDVSLNIAWDLLVSGNLNYAYLTLYQSIEKHAAIEWNMTDNSMLTSSGIIKIIDSALSTDPLLSNCLLKHFSDSSRGGYFKNISELIDNRQSVTTLIKVSGICAFRLGKNDVFLNRLGQLNKLRNDIAHEGKILNSYVEIEELLKLLYDIRITDI
jgi:CheY-like chemotaxis protein